MSALQWNTRTAYALTEFTTFAIGTTVLLAVAAFIVVIVCVFYFQKENDKLKAVLSLHGSILRAVFSGTVKVENLPKRSEQNSYSPLENQSKESGREVPQAENQPKESERTVSQTESQSRKSEQTMTFSGFLPTRKGKVWVLIYFSLLSGIVALWSLAVLSDTAFYRKVTACTDLSIKDNDMACFKISTRNVPPEVLRIIDEEEGELVPCRKVQDYITQNNVTFDLEVLCYVSQLGLVAAFGVAYGATKSVIFAIVVIFNIGRVLASKSKKLVVVAQALVIIVVILGILIVPATFHQVGGPRNSAFDFFRGERFFSFAVFFLCGITTIITVGLHPWWALDYKTKVSDLVLDYIIDTVKEKLEKPKE